MSEVLSRPVRRAPPLAGARSCCSSPKPRTARACPLAGRANASANVVNIPRAAHRWRRRVALRHDAIQAGARIVGCDMPRRCPVLVSSAPMPRSSPPATGGTLIHAGLSTQPCAPPAGRPREEGSCSGDVAHSRVALSDINTLVPLARRSRSPVRRRSCRARGDEARLGRHDLQPDLDRGADGADGVIALRLQKERQRVGCCVTQEYTRVWGLTEARFAVRTGEPVMHPGPMNEGARSSGGRDGKRSRWSVR